MSARARPLPALAAGAALALAFCGVAGCEQREAAPFWKDARQLADVPGRFHPIAAPAPEADSGVTPRGNAERLEAIGYASGFRIAPERSGVTRFDTRHSWLGVNLVVSGHAPEASLIAMDGRLLHRWHFAWWGAPPERGADGALERALPEFWRRATLGANGELLALFDGLGLVKLDRDSQPLWTLELPVHHDLATLPDGRILVLTREPRRVPALDPERDVLDDSIAILDADGRVQRSVSLLDALAASPYARLLERREAGRGYILHTNSIEVLDGRLASRVGAFRAGNVLVSMLGVDAIAVVDLDAERVVWSLTAEFVDPHDPSVLGDGGLLLFDNAGLGAASRVLELDPASGHTLWSYRGSQGEPFYTRWCGAAQRLPNGNTLISETEAGRGFEVTREGEIVWEFYNPQRAGSREELIAALFEVRRYPSEAAEGWTRPLTAR